MILYLDSNALAKLYIVEQETDAVLQAVSEAKTVVVSILAMPEVTSAFARKVRDGDISEDDAREAFRRLLEDWPTLERVEMDEWVVKEASILTLSRGVRGADGVQLATVARLARERRGVRFLTFDTALNEAAKGLAKPWEP